MHRASRYLSTAAAVFFTVLLASCGGGGGSSANGGGTGGGTSGATKALELTISSVPNGAQAVNPNVTFVFTFNAVLGASSVRPDQVLLSDGTTTYPVKVAINSGLLTVQPDAPLHTRTNYRLTVKAGITGSDGSVLKNDYVLTFKSVLAAYEAKTLTPPDPTVYGSDLPRIKVADINGDGRMDLIELADLDLSDSTSGGGYTLNVFVQNSTAGFDKLQKLELIATLSGDMGYFNNLIVLDIDGDSKPELLVAEQRLDPANESGIRVFKVDKAGRLTESSFIATKYTEILQAVDIDGDGKDDLVGTNRRAIDQATGGFQILLNTATGLSKLAPVVLLHGGGEFGVADMDGDGKVELIFNHLVAKPNNGGIINQLLVYSQTATGVFGLNGALTDETLGFCASTKVCREMKIADMNGDGKPDFIFVADPADQVSTGQQVVSYSRAPAGGLIKNFHVSIGYDASVFAVQDMDGDRIPDLFVIGAGFYSIVGGSPNFALEFSNAIRMPVFDTMYPPNVALADLDGDGQLDIIFDSYNSGIVMARNIKY